MDPSKSENSPTTAGAVKKRHPDDPKSNVPIFKGYDPSKFRLKNMGLTVVSSPALTPGCPPRLTQRGVELYLVPLTRELDEVPARPTVDELPEAVIDRMVTADRAWWVDPPGKNDYTLHDAFHYYNMVTEKVLPTPQAVFPRSYQYDLDCVRFMRERGCRGIDDGDDKRAVRAYCRFCAKTYHLPGKTAFQLKWSRDPTHTRWRDYPDFTTHLTTEQLSQQMRESVGRPFRSEACNWYNKNYPSVKYDIIRRRFGT